MRVKLRNLSLDMFGEDVYKRQQKNRPETPIDLSNVFIVWSCKTLHHFKCLASTSISGDGVYAEYTYNGIKEELYGDVYGKDVYKRQI